MDFRNPPPGADAEEQHSIAPTPTPNAAQLVIVGLDGETRRTVGLEVARALGRPFTDSRLLSGAPDDADPIDAEIAAVHRALGGTTRVVFACSVRVLDIEPGDSSESNPDDGSRTDLGRAAAEQLGSAWVVWIDHRSGGADGAANGIEVEHLTDGARRRRAERWADRRIDAGDHSGDELVGAILDAWTACPGR